MYLNISRGECLGSDEMPEATGDWYSQSHVCARDASVSPQNTAKVDPLTLAHRLEESRLEMINENSPRIATK